MSKKVHNMVVKMQMQIEGLYVSKNSGGFKGPYCISPAKYAL